MSTCLPPLSTEPGISEAVLRSAGVALETVVAHLQSVPRSSDAAMLSCGHAVPCGREQLGSSLSAAHLVSLCRQILQRLDAPFLEVPLLPQPICDSAGTNGNALCVDATIRRRQSSGTFKRARCGPGKKAESVFNDTESASPLFTVLPEVLLRAVLVASDARTLARLDCTGHAFHMGGRQVETVWAPRH